MFLKIMILTVYLQLSLNIFGDLFSQIGYWSSIKQHNCILVLYSFQ